MSARLALLALLLLAAGLGLRDPWPADEPRFALVARDMVLSGEWLIPHVAGEPYPDKPPVLMWAIAAFYQLTGSLRLAFLLPSLLAGLGILLLVYDLARRLWGARAAGLAGLLLLVTVQFTTQARTAQIDALVAFWILLGVYGLVRHLLLGPHWRWYFAAWFAMGIGVITKGVGFLPVFMLLPWAWLRWKAPERLPRIEAPAWRWWAGPLVALFAVSLWGVPMLVEVAASGSPELARYRDEILFRQTAERYVDSWAHLKPFWYYLVEVLPWAWFPLTLALPWLAPAWWRRLRARDPATWLLLGWALCVLIFFSLSPGKRGVYLLPALPAVVLAAAPFLEELLERRGVQRLAWLSVGAIAVASFLVLLFADIPIEAAGFDPRGVIAAFAALAALLAVAARRIGGVVALAVLIFGGWQLYAWWAAPRMDAARSGAELMARVTKAVPLESELALAGWKEQLVLQIERPVVHFGFRRDEPEETRDASAWLARERDRYLLIPRSQMAPCLDPDAGRSMGVRHREDWRLVDATALTGRCTLERPARVRLYDPAIGGLLAPGKRQPEAAADEEEPAQARDEAHALAGKE